MKEIRRIIGKKTAWKTWFWGSVSALLLLLGALSVFNYRVDRIALFHPDVIEEAAKELVNGNMIGGNPNFDDRLTQLHFIENFRTKWRILDWLGDIFCLSSSVSCNSFNEIIKSHNVCS